MAMNPKRLLSLHKLVYKLSGHQKYGLLRDDLISDEDNDDVKEAIKRLPSGLYDARNFRILRAIQLSLAKEVLPKEQWTRYKDDKLYLTPILKDVIRERLEREKWNQKY